MGHVKEKRGAERFACNVPLTFQLSNFQKAYSAMALNFSEDGIAFETDYALTVGATVFIRTVMCSEAGRFNLICPFSRSTSFATIRWTTEKEWKGTTIYAVGAKNFNYACGY